MDGDQISGVEFGKDFGLVFDLGEDLGSVSDLGSDCGCDKETSMYSGGTNATKTKTGEPIDKWAENARCYWCGAPEHKKFNCPKFKNGEPRTAGTDLSFDLGSISWNKFAPS